MEVGPLGPRGQFVHSSVVSELWCTATGVEPAATQSQSTEEALAPAQQMSRRCAWMGPLNAKVRRLGKREKNRKTSLA